MEKKSRNVMNFIYDLLGTLLNYGMTVYMGLLIVVLPFYFEQGYGYIATDKASFFCKMSVNMGKVLIPVMIFYAISAIAVNHAKIIPFLKKNFSVTGIKALICKISALDFFVGMYGVSVILSYLCSDYQETALWGTAGWYMGFVPQMILVCAYFLIAKFWEPKKWLFGLILPVAAVVFVLGYLNRFGYYPFEMEYANPSFISTIGNINWYCSYVVPVLFAGIGLFWIKGNLLYGTFIFVGFATLITQGSASGIFALGVMLVVLLCLSVNREDWTQKFWIITLLLSLGCVMTMIVRNRFPEALTYRDRMLDVFTQGKFPIIMTIMSLLGVIWSFWNCKRKNPNRKIVRKFAILCVTLVSCIAVVYVILLTVNTLNPGVLGELSESDIFTLSDKWGSSRGATWKVGLHCFMEQDFLHKLVGVGPDAMWPYIDKGGNGALIRLVQKNFGMKIMLTNAHNEWLTVLVNYGILGLVSFVGIIVSAVWSFFSRKNTDNGHVLVACAFGILAYTLNNMFSFQQVVNVTMLYLLLGMGRAFLREAKSPAE